ncbi:MAG: sugar O-acetyltransferase [Anaerovoracaceae bacterium]|jgi:maltose O-acetyltransferase
MTELEKLEAGLEYCFDDPEVEARKQNAVRVCDELEKIPSDDMETRAAFVKENLFGPSKGSPAVQKGFRCDCGRNICVGDNFTSNYNVTILDIAPVTIGDNVMLAPGVVITTVGHPINAERRRAHMAKGDPVVIGDDVWVGANAIILPGVTVGSNVVIAAGAVVTHDVPDNCIYAGVPAKLLKKIEP